MADKIKIFLTGLIVGAIVAFPLGINYGRNAPLLSNPFEKPDIKTKVKDEAKAILKGAKESIHEATKPSDKK
jgi:hypothetical protein